MKDGKMKNSRLQDGTRRKYGGDYDADGNPIDGTHKKIVKHRSAQEQTLKQPYVRGRLSTKTERRSKRKERTLEDLQEIGRSC